MEAAAAGGTPPAAEAAHTQAEVVMGKGENILHPKIKPKKKKEKKKKKKKNHINCNRPMISKQARIKNTHEGESIVK